jgi:streptogramin lyase
MKLEQARLVVLLALTLLLAGLNLSLAQGPGPADQLNPLGGIALPAGPWAVDPRQQVPAAAGSTLVTEYTLPVPPTNLLIGSSGEIWFSSIGTKVGANSDGAIGKLDVSQGTVVVYRLTGHGNMWGLAQDSQGAIWYTTALDDYVGKLDPSTSMAQEWSVPKVHYGVDVDSATGDVWFTTRENTPGIYRLSPGTNKVTAWATDPYTGTYSLDVASNGKVWFTLSVGSNQGVARLDPATDQVTLWTMPIADSKPFIVHAERPQEIWFTELGTAANSVARLVPKTNTLDEFKVPTPGAYPAGVTRLGGRTWFTEFAVGKVGWLDPELAASTETVLERTTFQAMKSTQTIAPSSFTVQPQTTPVDITETPVNVTTDTGWAEFALPIVQSWPFGIVGDADGGNAWFAEQEVNKLGRFAVASTLPPDTPVLSRIQNDNGDGNFDVCWSEAAGASKYLLEEDDNSAFGTPETVYSGPDTCTPIRGSPLGTWYYRVKARNDVADSAWSNTREVTVEKLAPEPASVYLPMVYRFWPPQEPLTLLPIDNPGGDGTYTVRWNPRPEAHIYYLQEATNGAFVGAKTVFEGVASSFEVTGRGAARYYYRVRAETIDGDPSGWSNVEWVDVLWEHEPNDDALTQANGPIVSGLTYYGTFPLLEDRVDHFFFDMPTAKRVDIFLSKIPPFNDYDLYLLDAGLGLVALSERPGSLEEHIATSVLPAGRYYIRVVNAKSLVSTQAYQLKPEFE